MKTTLSSPNWFARRLFNMFRLTPISRLLL